GWSCVGCFSSPATASSYVGFWCVFVFLFRDIFFKFCREIFQTTFFCLFLSYLLINCSNFSSFFIRKDGDVDTSRNGVLLKLTRGTDIYGCVYFLFLQVK